METAASLKASDYKGTQVVCFEVDMIVETGSRFEAYREGADCTRPLKDPQHKGEQVVCYAADGFKGNMGAKAGNIGYVRGGGVRHW